MFSILVAYTKHNRIIGSNGKIPWNLPSERNRFKEITKNKYILMGRKSFMEIGHALPYCTIIIISKTLQTPPKGCLLFNNINDAINFAKKENCEVLIAGGSEIYKKLLPLTSIIYATEIDKEYEGDTFFPQIDNNEWEKSIEKECCENGISYDYVTYRRRMADQL